MKVLTIAAKEYILEFSFEAALYGECTEKIINLFDGLAQAQDNSNAKAVIASIINTPETVLTMFYAGLMEYNPVESKDAAKVLLKQYFKDNKDSPDVSNNTFYGMAECLMEQMEVDGFFKQIGLDLGMKPIKQPKTPQDRKPRVVKASGK